jgi:uncharacterized protein YdaT
MNRPRKIILSRDQAIEIAKAIEADGISLRYAIWLVCGKFNEKYVTLLKTDFPDISQHIDALRALNRAKRTRGFS